MDIEKFLDLGTELELKISKIYEKLAGLTNDASLSKRLMSLSGEEINHANTLRTGKNHLKEMPDLFVGVQLGDEEIRSGLDGAGAVLSELDAGLGVSKGLKRLLELEKRFERIHLGISVKIGDPSLEKLFKTLAKGDQNHIAVLTGIIATL
jgi:rubrerythrin